mgnify:CR=1 FL=1
MNRIFLIPIAILAVLTLSSWGFYAHKVINRMAVFTLPADMAGFYKTRIDYMTEHAIDPDKRCYIDTAESPRHFIDADEYGQHPFDSIPVHWTAAVEKFSERRLLLSGILPWQINRSYRSLVKAFREKNVPRILKHSSDLGHYLADAHVPLHTTSNYNGQKTNQVGIHAFWESRLPEQFAGVYDFLVGRARYIESPVDEAWRIVRESHRLVDSVLRIETDVAKIFSPDRKFGYIERNHQLIRTYSDAYAAAYHHALNGMVERRMRGAIHSIGSFWYSAWVDAGQPDIRHLPAAPVALDSIPTPAAGQKAFGREEWH